QGCQTVGGARCIRYHRVGRLQHAMVHAVHDRGVNILATGGGNDDFLGTTLQVGRCLLFAGEEAGALEHDVDIQLTPGQRSGITFGQHTDAVAVHNHVVTVDRHFAREAAVGAVVLGKVGVCLGCTQIIDGHDLDIVLLAAFVVGTQDVAADAPITIDRHAN